MKTVRILMVGALCVGFATLANAQNSGISPVYIPGTNLDINNAVKTVDSKRSITQFASTKSITGRTSTTTQPITGQPIPNPSAIGTSSGCGCDSGCGCGTGCDSGCNSGCCGDRIGRSFFGRVRNLIPIKFSFGRGNSGCDQCDSCSPGNCEYLGGPLARLLPVSVRMCSNHCCKYTSFFGGYVDLEDYDGMIAPLDRLVEFNGGWQMGIKRGRVFENGLRLESEFTFRHNTIDSYSVGNFVGPDFVPTMTFDAIDSVYQISSMTNLLVDLKGLTTNGFTPYVGFGTGGVYADGDIIVPATGVNLSIDDYAWAYQLIVGVNRSISNNVVGFAEYKYFGTSGVDVDEAGVAVGDFDLQSNNLIVGLSFIRPNRCCR